jgi:hypothetical protein
MDSGSRRMRIYVATLIAVLVATESRAANSDQTAPRGTESLGGRLLDDLSPDASQPKAAQQPTAKPKSMKELEDSLKASTPLQGLSAGANPTAQSLSRVQHGMQNAQALLAKPGADAKDGTARLAGPVQQEVLSDLDKLIAELSKQCQCCNGQCQGGGKDSQKPGQNSQSNKSGKPGTASGRGKTAARDSTDRLDSTTAKPVDKGAVDEMVKALWGHLPARNREQMLQSFSNEFLPKYELEIEQYYRRLSEEESPGQQK